jgi:hypothetical protein
MYTIVDMPLTVFFPMIDIYIMRINTRKKGFF